MGATFGDLVTTVGALDDVGAADSDASCLLRHLPGAALRLEADLAVAVRPLPPASSNLAARLRATGGAVQVLGRWGRVGPRDAGLNLVAISSGAPRASDARVIVLFVTPGEIHLRTTGVDLPSALLRPVPAIGPEQVSAVRSVRPDAILVTADASVALSTLLTRVRPIADMGFRIGLTVLLPPETRLPDAGAAEEASSVGLCPAGLPEIATEDQGERDAASVRQVLGAIHASAQGCMASVGGGMATEGVMHVLLRVGPGGGVATVCARQDELEVAALRVCILERLRRLDFGPAPGFVDIALPLRLVSQGASSQRLECGREPPR